MSNTNEVLIRPEPSQEDQTPVETDEPLPDVKVEQIDATAEEEPRPSERCAPEVQLLLQLPASASVVDHCALTSICNNVTSHASHASHAQPRSLTGQTDVIILCQAIRQTISSEPNFEVGLLCSLDTAHLGLEALN